MLAVWALASASASASASATTPQTKFPSQQDPYPVFSGSYGSTMAEHRRFGMEFGTRMKREISAAVASSVSGGTLSIIKPYMETPNGTASYNVMLATHMGKTPSYVAEITGMAAGAGVPFNLLFALNVGESLSTVADPYKSTDCTTQRRPWEVEHCSDYMMWPYLAHNEDGAPSDIAGMSFVNVTIDGSRFFGFVYAGMLATGAFGWNDHGVGFTLNYVAPCDADIRGIGRNFVSRDLLRATNLTDLIFRATVAFEHATGHNFQLMSYKEHKLCNVEVAPGSRRFSLRCFNATTPPFFHTNDYRTLKNVTQYKSPSSLQRIARAAAMPVPKTPEDLLVVLGDQEDAVQPIFHDSTSFGAGDQSNDATITTMLFNVAARTATQFRGNPKNFDILKIHHV